MFMKKVKIMFFLIILVEEIFQIISKRPITSFFVIDTNEKVIGLVHIHDCLRVGN